MNEYFVYIMASHSNDSTLYIGVTNDLERRVAEHKLRLQPGFTERYNCDKLVYFESSPSVEAAIAREKQLKRWHRSWKLNLIAENNPDHRDLSRIN